MNRSSGGASPKRVSEATSKSSVTEDSSSASESEHEDAETIQSQLQRDAKVPAKAPVASRSGSGSPKAKAGPKSPSSPKAKAKASSSASLQVLKPPSPKAERRRSSNSLVPKELQGLQAGADFEAAKVRRAVKAAAQRVKAHKNPRAKKKVTSRSELLACLFNALGGYVTNYLSSSQLLRMALLLGFEAGEAEWDNEYVVLCRSYNWNATLGASRRQFAELLADEDSDAYSNDMELATMLSNLRVPAPKQLPRDDLVKEFFIWADINRNGRLGRAELLRFAKHLGFQGTSKDWDKEYEYMARRYHWGTFFGGFRDSRDGCDLGQFSRMLADPDGLCFCDEGALQVELAELEMLTGRPYFSRMLSQEVLEADQQQRHRSALMIQELWRGRLRARALLRDLREKLLNRKELKQLIQAEDELKLRMAKAAVRIWKWWKPWALRRKWLTAIAGVRAAKKQRERQMREAKRKEELKAKRLKELSDLQEHAQIRANLLAPDETHRMQVKRQQEKKRELTESRQKAIELQEKYKRTASSKFVEGRKPKEWKQICLPWSDTWEESAAGIIRKEGISIAMESDRFEVLNRKGIPFSMRDKRLQAASGRRLVLQSDFPMLLNIKVWTIAELQRRLREPDKELCQSQAAIQKQIEQLERGRPGKLLEPHEKLKLERLRQEEAELKVRSQESRAVLEGILRSRATVLLQAVVRGCGARRRQKKRREAAKVLQRGWRGYLSRVRLENLKALARQRVKQVKHVRNAESLFEAVKDLQEAIAIRVIKDKDFNPFIFRHAVSQQSLLHAAAQEGLHVLCHELLTAAKQRGMDSFIVARDWRGWTALHTAAKSGQVECCKELLTAEELTEPPGSLGRNGQTALHVAALQGHTEVVKVLLAAQSFEEEVDRRDRWGRTALHLAVEQQHVTAAVSLAEHVSFNIDAGPRSAWGQSALDLASPEMKEALRAAHQRKLGALPGRRRNLVVATKDDTALKGDATE